MSELEVDNVYHVYSVLETTFVDAKEVEGDDRATSNIYIFSSVEKAERFVKDKERSFCEDYLEENGDEEEREEGYVDAHGSIVAEYLDDLFDSMTKGAFVPATYILEIDEHVVDSHCIPPEIPKKTRFK